jgi:hypothetical protein
MHTPCPARQPLVLSAHAHGAPPAPVEDWGSVGESPRSLSDCTEKLDRDRYDAGHSKGEAGTKVPSVMTYSKNVTCGLMMDGDAGQDELAKRSLGPRTEALSPRHSHLPPWVSPRSATFTHNFPH